MKISLDFSGKSFKGASLSVHGAFEGGLLPKTTKKFEGKEGESFLSAEILWLGLGKKEKYSLEKARRAAAKALSQAKALQAGTLALDMEAMLGAFNPSEVTAAVVEGARLSSYRFDKYKSKRSPVSEPSVLTLVFPPKPDARMASAVRKALHEAEIVSGAVTFARDLANEPPNVMTPPALAAAAKEMAKKNGLICRVLGRAEMKKLGMGGILGVSQGSIFEPQFIILENKVASDARPVVLVGKGITFDTGGISIKPSGDMDKMKFDMCGAAAVIGAMKAVAELKFPMKVVGLAPVCENMPGSTAQRPGDILRISNGKTVEVLNTDAEGRLILADALSYAKRYAPKALVDIATLTGACAATFSDRAIAVMGTDPELVAKIERAGEKTGERCWELPLWDEYLELIRATYADIQNISKKAAGTITAGMFLKEFADHTKSWAHLDIAGTAWNDNSPKPLSPIGATGVGVRLFVELLKEL